MEVIFTSSILQIPTGEMPSSGTCYYGELSPRLSLGKIYGKEMRLGITKGVLVTSTAEIGSGFHNYLYGPG